MADLGVPCQDWPIIPCCPDWPTDPAQWTPAQQRAASMAGTILWRLSAGRYGLCEQTVRPCGKDCAGGPSLATLAMGMPWVPLLIDGQWINCSGCGCGSGPCGGCCPPICEVTLPGPVHAITSVKVDGAIVPASNYVVYDRTRLVAQGDACWPTCQDYRYPDTEPGTWSITYTRGIPVPDDGQLAAGALACDLLKACDTGSCSLPRGVTRVDREGLTYEIDPEAYYSSGRTGVRMADLWLMTVNPYDLRTQAGVWSPAKSTPAVQTWPASP